MSGEAETYVYAGGQEAAVDMDDMSMIDRGYRCKEQSALSADGGY